MRKIILCFFVCLSASAFADTCTVVIKDRYDNIVDFMTRDEYSRYAACDHALYDCNIAVSERQINGGWGLYCEVVPQYPPSYPRPYPQPYPPSYPPQYPPRYPDPRAPGPGYPEPRFPRPLPPGPRGPLPPPPPGPRRPFYPPHVPRHMVELNEQ